ncbi:MAG: thiamine-phosphate kinase [Opitutaceae bacterium]|nr:thiamine-phosphate kinase [Opitutaceae bacterium]
MSIFAKEKRLQVGSLGESELIRRIRAWLGPVVPESPFGMGDDCAVTPPNSRQGLITVDPVIHGRHFDDEASARLVGAKLVRRNLSDIAAMGGEPLHAVISLAIPPRVSIDWIQRFHAGLAAEAARNRFSIVGGDVAEAPVFMATLTLVGRVKGDRALTRTGSRRGDWIFVTGSLGGSLLGRHLRFEPRLVEGQWLATRPEVRSMMDVSDGLAKDLASLTPQGLVPALDPSTIPASRAARTLAARTGRKPWQHALGDGEDYELVFSVDSKANLEEFTAMWRRRFRLPVTCIGRFVQAGKLPKGAINALQEKGYEHFCQAP